MSRKTRLYDPDTLCHVILRGNGGQRIFFCAQIGSFLMKKLIVLIMFLFFVSPLYATQREEVDYPLKYEIAKVDDISIAGAKRLRYRVRLGGIYNQNEAIIVLHDIVGKHHTNGNYVNAIKFFLYFPGSHAFSYADGSIDWAPYGDWSKASSVRAGHYSEFRYKVNFYEDEESQEYTRNGNV